jgi:hypothetical protein
MLTDGDRAQLAPHVADILAARAALFAGESAAATAQKQVTDLKKSTSVWDRWLLAGDTPARRAVREAVKAQTEARAAVAEARRRVDDLNRAFDLRIAPMMPRIDRGYEGTTAVIDSCAHAAEECRAMAPPIGILVTTVRTAVKTGSDARTRKDAEAARFRYPDHLARARTASRAVKLAVDAANSTIARARGHSRRFDWNDTLLDRLPKTADKANRLTGEVYRLTGLPHRLDRLRKELITYRAQAERGQERARAKAREHLVETSST